MCSPAGSTTASSQLQFFKIYPLNSADANSFQCIQTITITAVSSSQYWSQAAVHVVGQASGWWLHVDLDMLDGREFQACGAATDSFNAHRAELGTVDSDHENRVAGPTAVEDGASASTTLTLISGCATLRQKHRWLA
jgi:hypothetical protein